MERICKEASKIIAPPTRFLQMIKEHGALNAAKILINNEKIQDGFTNLILMKRQDLTMEYVMLNPKYERLFDKRELDECSKRLGDMAPK